MAQTWVLKVSIHCEGCKKKVKKVLQKVEGVYSIDIDSKQNRVTVNGSVDAESLIRRLLKYGKHAELLQEENRTAENTTFSSAAAADDEEKGEEKTSAAVLETEQKRNTDQGEPIVTPEAQQEATASEITAPKPDNDDATLNSSSDKSSKLEDNNSEKPAAAGAESNKGKEVQGEESGEDEGPVYYSGNFASQIPENPFMVNPQPAYTMSYSTIHPSTSYAYYEAPPAMPSTYGYSAYPPPSGFSPEYYSSESFYRSMEPAASFSGRYDMFNEENPNACNLM